MITEEKRQALIDEALSNIDNLRVAIKHCDQDESYALELDLDLQYVALASLRAEPVSTVVGKLGACIRSTRYEGMPEPQLGSKLYTAPPVQVIDIKALPELEKWRSPEGVRAQAAYRQLIINMLEKG